MKERKLLTRRILSVILALTMTMSLFGNFAVLAEREYAADVSIMGTAVQLKNVPYSEYGAVFAPLEELCGYIGIAVSKDGDMYTMTRAGHSVQLQVGNMYAMADGVRKDLAFSPTLRNGELYVPMEFFSLCFDIPVSVDADSRSADITPNVYTIGIDEQHAAAVRAQSPDEDVLSLTATGADTLRDHMDLFPEKSSYVYYKANLDMFKGKKIKSAVLNMTVKRNEVGPSITAVRTAPWTKGEITWNNQPVLKEEKSPEFKTTATGNVSASLDITALVNAAMSEGTDLSMKILGTHRAGEKNEKDKHTYTVLGVNSATPPAISITVEETYNFPIKETTQENTEDENRYSEMGILRSLGVFTENDEFPLDFNEGIMRWEFIRYALRLANAQIVKGSSQHFSDVPADAPFFDEVNTARSLSYIAGDAGVAFRPYDYITLGEAITVMGRILNYDVYAEERGGFTPGYFDAARIGELYMGATTATKILSFNEMFKILRNALDAAVLEVTTYSSNGTAVYIFNENKNILTEYWNAKVIEGTVTKNEFSDLKNPAGSGKENTIYIDSKELKLLFKEYNNFLGYRVKGWYDNDDRLLYMGIKEYDITEIDLASVTGDSVDENTDPVTFTYKKANGSNASESFSVKSEAGNEEYVIYNGKSIAAGDLKNILLSEADGGSIKLIGDSLTVIEAYRTMIVTSVDVENERIYDLYDTYKNTLYLKDCDYYSFENAKGVEIPLTSIKTDDVISVAKSLDEKIVKGIVAGKKITGKIEAVENEGSDDEIITIGGTEYTLANQSSVWTANIGVGASGSFYIDAFGQIVGFEGEKLTDISGYIVTVAEGGSGLRKKVQAAIMTKSSENYEVYDFADKVEIDGKKEKIEELSDIENCFKEEGTFKPQGIIFGLNTDGKINKVDTYYKDSQKSDPTDKENPETTLNKRTVSEGGRYDNGNFYNHYFLNSSSTLSVLNTASSSPTIDDYITLSGVLPDSATESGSTGRASTEIYTIGNITPNVVIAYSMGSVSSSAGKDDRLMLFDRSVYAYDADGMEVRKIYYYDGANRNSVILRDDLDNGTLTQIDAINRGDIFRFGADTSGRLSAVERVYDYENRSFATFVRNSENKKATDYLGDTSYKGDNRVYGGYTTHMEDGYLRISEKPDATYEDLNNSATKYLWNPLSKIEKAGFYKYDANSAGIEVVAATQNDIRLSSHAPLASTGIILFDTDDVLRKNVWLLELSEMYTYSYSGDGVTDTSVNIAAKDEVITLAPAPSRTNYDFAGWDINGEIKQPGESYTVNSSVTIKATWGGYNPSIKFSFVNQDGTSIYDDWWKINKPASTEFVTHKLPTQADLDEKGYDSGEKVLTGWKDSKGTSYAPGEDYIPGNNGYTPESSAGETFTAEWKIVPKANFVFKDGDTEIHTYKWALEDIDENPESHTLPTADMLANLENSFVKENHVLLGWEDSEGNLYPAGETYIPESEGVSEGETITFTAQWYSIWSGEAPTDADMPAFDANTNTYSIANGNQLAWFSKNANATDNAILTNDIYLNNFFDGGAFIDGTELKKKFDEDWYEAEKEDGAYTTSTAKNWYNYAIGRTTEYTGIFDGNDKTVYGLYTTSTASDIGGLFFNITGGTVKNLKVKGAYVVSAVESNEYNTGRASVIANIVNGGTIEGVEVHGLITAAAKKCSANLAGSIAVEVQNGASITNNTSYVNIDLSGGITTYTTSTTSVLGVGGIVGAVKTATPTVVINGNTNHGDINAPYSQAAGGIIGWVNAHTLLNKTEFKGNTNEGDIVAGAQAGKIIGSRKGVDATTYAGLADYLAQNTANGSAKLPTTTP